MNENYYVFSQTVNELVLAASQQQQQQNATSFDESEDWAQIEDGLPLWAQVDDDDDEDGVYYFKSI